MSCAKIRTPIPSFFQYTLYVGLAWLIQTRNPTQHLCCLRKVWNECMLLLLFDYSRKFLAIVFMWKMTRLNSEHFYVIVWGFHLLKRFQLQQQATSEIRSVKMMFHFKLTCPHSWHVLIKVSDFSVTHLSHKTRHLTVRLFKPLSSLSVNWVRVLACMCVLMCNVA